MSISKLFAQSAYHSAYYVHTYILKEGGRGWNLNIPMWDMNALVIVEILLTQGFWACNSRFNLLKNC